MISTDKNGTLHLGVKGFKDMEFCKFSGTVADRPNKGSNTSVYTTSGLAGNKGISSTTHHNTSFWLIADNGNQRSVKLNFDYECREGQKITVYYLNGYLAGINNHTTHTYRFFTKTVYDQLFKTHKLWRTFEHFQTVLLIGFIAAGAWFGHSFDEGIGPIFGFAFGGFIAWAIAIAAILRVLVGLLTGIPRSRIAKSLTNVIKNHSYGALTEEYVQKYFK